jgi:LDH2 family malate/lactate/ureidoglycolate dehydrogenase
VTGVQTCALPISVSLPGERGWTRRDRRMQEGIPVLGSTLDLLDRLGNELGLPLLKRGRL